MIDEKKAERIVSAVSACAEVAQRVVNDFGMDLWLESFLALSDEHFDRGMQFLRVCYKEQRLPKITDVECFARGELGGEDEAALVSDLIASAIIKFGLPNLEAAKNFMGELAWEVVQSVGGWSTVCAVESNKDLQIAKSQWRQTAKHVKQRALGGFLSSTPNLPKPPAKGLVSAADLITRMLQ
jgi:hypothetical protein